MRAFESVGFRRVFGVTGVPEFVYTTFIGFRGLIRCEGRGGFGGKPLHLQIRKPLNRCLGDRVGRIRHELSARLDRIWGKP